MSQIALLESIADVYRNCSTYRDAGEFTWEFNGYDGILKFETYFRRPDCFRFSWTGRMYCARGEGYKFESPQSTIVGSYKGRAYRYDPRYAQSQGIESVNTLESILVDDSVYSGSISKIIAPLLMPDKLSHLSNILQRFNESRTEHVESHPDCVVLVSSKGSDQLDKVIVQNRTLLIRQVHRSAILPRREDESIDEIGKGSRSFEEKDQQKRSHKTNFNFVDSAIDAELGDELFDPERLQSLL